MTHAQPSDDVPALGVSEVEAKALSVFADTSKEHHEATAGAKQAIDRDPGDFIRFPYDGVHALTGPIPPGDLITVAGYSGHGKTTFATRVFNALTSLGIKGMYVGLESKPSVIKIHWACARLAQMGVFIHPGDAIKGRLNPKSPEALPDAEVKAAILHRAIEQLDKEDDRGFKPMEYGRIVPVRWLTSDGVQRLTEFAFANGVKFVVYDHGDHIASSQTSNNGYGQREDVYKKIHDGAKSADLTTFLLSQMNTDAVKGDGLRVHLFPTTDMVYFGSLKRQLSDGMLCVYRPAIPFPTDTTIEDLPAAQEEHAKRLRAARKSPEAIQAILLPNVMAIGQMKDRAYGREGPSAVAYLSVRNGALADVDPVVIRAAQRGLILREDGPPQHVGKQSTKHDRRFDSDAQRDLSDA